MEISRLVYLTSYYYLLGVNPLSVTHCEVCLMPFYFEEDHSTWIFITLLECLTIVTSCALFSLFSWALGKLIIHSSSKTENLKDFLTISSEYGIALLGFIIIIGAFGTLGLLFVSLFFYYLALPEERDDSEEITLWSPPSSRTSSWDLFSNTSSNEADYRPPQSAATVVLPGVLSPQSSLFYPISPRSSLTVPLLEGNSAPNPRVRRVPRNIIIRRMRTLRSFIRRTVICIIRFFGLCIRWEVFRFLCVYVGTGVFLTWAMDPKQFLFRGILGLMLLLMLGLALPCWAVIYHSKRKLALSYRVRSLE